MAPKANQWAEDKGRLSTRLTESYGRKKVISKRQKDKSSFPSLLVSFLSVIREPNAIRCPDIDITPLLDLEV